MIPDPAHDIFMYYSAVLAVGVIYFLWRRPDRRMRLKMKGSAKDRDLEERARVASILSGRKDHPAEKLSHISAANERPLNVIFNYNGESWDAYEVLGLPAGSSIENVERAYRQSLNSIDAESRSFIEAAYAAIQAQWKHCRPSGTR